jgi:2-polyprenyl-3-methyl-5-hydroxy-6-metoxy-1,4-benzoquinol methylase
MAELTNPDQWTRFYGTKVTFGRLNRWVNRSVIERELYDVMAESLPARPGTSVVEMGCANSDWLPYYWSDYGYSIYGIDYLEAGCRLAERKLEAAGCSEHRIFCGDFRDLHEKTGRQFDIVVSFGVIEHFEEPGELIATFRRYLRDGGLMITVCPNTAGHAMHLQKYVDKRIYDGHLRFGLDDLVEYHRHGGMETLRASHLGLMSLNNLDFSGYGRVGGLLKMLVKLVNGPLVALLYALKKLGLPLGDPRLSAALIVVARKPAAVDAKGVSGAQSDQS